MGLGGISIWQLLIILVIVMVLFGTKKLRNIGSDLGGAIKSFRGAMRDGEKEAEADEQAKRLEEAEKSKAGQAAELAAKDKNPWDEKKV